MSVAVTSLRVHALLCILIWLSLVTNCGDPGYRLRPVGWQRVAKNEWSGRFGDVELRSGGIRGLIGDSSVEPDLRIHNSEAVSLESAELLTPTGKYPAEVYGNRVIPPSAGDYHFPIQFNVNKGEQISKAIGESCTIILKVKTGKESREIKIDYERN
jgi:hypothetical protein